ncbi:hypothetical protein BRARA_E01861 [Brassica rapa]|uniref:Ubiquitin-like protease family profile domain-containing protein n=1 Tax=Brassica campestris TaxID=3711 RepID=A0A397ZCZ1_BRACM|nr:hypothetical protein BRARA_E01861 [Brassica rapa]
MVVGKIDDDGIFVNKKKCSLSTLSVLTSSSARILSLFVIDRILNSFARNRLRRILIYEFVFPNFHPGHFPHVRETIGLDVWEELLNSPIGEVARLAERESMWLGNAKGKGKVKGKRNEKKRMKGGVLSEGEPPTKKQKKVKTQNESEADAAGNESEADAAGKGSSEKEGSKELELENKATLTTIVNTLDIISRKFDHVDSRLEAYELDRNIPLMDQKTIDDRVNALLEERLKDLGIGKIPENHDNPSPPLSNPSPPLSKASPVVRTHQESVNSPALVAATPRQKKNLAKELEKEPGVKRALDEEFGGVDKDNDLDFLLISPAKATKDDKSTKDDKAAKDPAYGRGCRRTRIVKGEEADEKKKAAQADAAFKKKEKAEAKKKAAENKKKEAEAKKKEAEAKKKEAAAKKKVVEAKKKEAELKKKQEAKLKKQNQAGSKYKKVTPPPDDAMYNSSLEVVAEQDDFAPESDVENSELVRSAIIKEFREKYVWLSPKGLSTTAVSSSFDFPTVGHDGTTWMRKNVTPSSAIYDPLAPVDPALLEKLMQYIKAIPPKPPAPPGTKEHIVAYMNVLIKRSMREPTPFWSKRIAFVDLWWQSFLLHDYNQFKMGPTLFLFSGNGYEHMVNGRIPDHSQTNLRWYEDVDHLYGCLQTGGNHWVAYHVDLKKEKIDCYDPIFGEVTPESEQRILNSFKPLTHMIPTLLSVHIPASIRPISRKKFSFRRRSKRYTPQNTQIGDCGVYSLKFVECLVLGVTFDGINDQTIQGLRVKMAADILAEGGNILTLGRT